MILFLHLVFAPLHCYFISCLICLPALQNHSSSQLLFLFESVYYPPVNGSLLLLVMWGTHFSFLQEGNEISEDWSLISCVILVWLLNFSEIGFPLKEKRVPLPCRQTWWGL